MIGILYALVMEQERKKVSYTRTCEAHESKGWIWKDTIGVILGGIVVAVILAAV